MGKLDRRLREGMEDECGENICEDAGGLLHQIYEIGDKLRTVSQTSQDMNELSEAFDNMMLSEAFDNMMNAMIKMKPEEIQIVQRLW
jgi:hypothetical protein